jgi:hypothetical protein
MALTAVAESLRDAMIAAYEPHVLRRLDALSIEPRPDIDGAVEAGRDWLVEQLRLLLARPYPEQRRSPLEVFQESMRFPTQVLAARGLPPVRRDEVAERALPGDLYDLAPSSSATLGEAVWRAHLAWGAEKAAVMTQPGR